MLRGREGKKRCCRFYYTALCEGFEAFFNFISSDFIGIFFLSSTSPGCLKLFHCFSFDTVFHSFQSIALKMVRCNVVFFTSVLLSHLTLICPSLKHKKVTNSKDESVLYLRKLLIACHKTHHLFPFL